MRDALQPFEGQRIAIQATVRKLSTRIGWAGVREPTILFGDVSTLDGVVLTDHLWMLLGKRLAALDLHSNDVVQFTGRVAVYRRGLKRLPGEPATFNVDYGLVYPSRCVVVARAVDAPAREHEVPVASALCTATDVTLPPAGPPVPASVRLLNGIETLVAETGEPPSLKHLYAYAPMPPTTFLSHLHKQAKAGHIEFQPDGRVSVTASSNHTQE
jgi:hypothetical protein